MTERALLTIAFTAYWRTGSGASGAGDIDTPALRSADGLPYVPARQLKGLLREGAQRLEDARHDDWTPGTVDLLFGTRADGTLSLPGVLDFRDACLPEAVRHAIDNNPKDARALAATLFTRMASTRINHETGTADDRSLRTVEAVVPLTLATEVQWMPRARLAQDPTAEPRIKALQARWPSLLDAAAALVLAVGGQRSDGLGRAIVSVSPESGAAA